MGNEVADQPWPTSSSLLQFIDQNRLKSSVTGLYSGVLEWADTPVPTLPPDLEPVSLTGAYLIEPTRYRAIVGGPVDFSTNMNLRLSNQCEPMLFAFEESTRFFMNVGFRCVRNVLVPFESEKLL